ncbi:putative G-protein coupled receptor 19 [Liparis tanakae]|uniref:Probable G-protein coupled receptor 19 n=1 Tax=Liparis tanakae TaxID=230148 RepID=A0A4Z2F497_9TELE|nr:putative G-protein coupled receptor 19 [Liparis tanakae]
MVFGQPSPSAGGAPSLLRPSLAFQMSLNFSERRNSTGPAPFASPALCGLEGAAPGRPNGTSPAPELTAGEAAVLGLLSSALWLGSLLGNGLVVLVVHRSRRSQSTTNYFVVSMACADLLMSLGWAPFVLLQVASGRWPLSAAACKAVRYLQHLCPGVQVYVLLSISVDRFYSIVYPLSFKVSREKAKRMIVASWLLDAAFVSPCLFFYGSSSAGAGRCDFFLPDSWGAVAYAAVHLLLGFVGPVALIASFYQQVVRYIWRVSADGRAVRRTMNIVPRTKVKTIKMFLVLNSVFFLSWTPFYVAQLWHPRETEGRGRQGLLLSTAIAWLGLSSTASKPTMYSVYNANFRRGMRETFCMSSMKCYRSNAYTVTASSRLAKRNYVGVAELPGHAEDCKLERELHLEQLHLEELHLEELHLEELHLEELHLEELHLEELHLEELHLEELHLEQLHLEELHLEELHLEELHLEELHLEELHLETTAVQRQSPEPEGNSHMITSCPGFSLA